MADLLERDNATRKTLAWVGPGDTFGQWILMPAKLSLGLYFAPNPTGSGRVEFAMNPIGEIDPDNPATGDAFSWTAGTISYPYWSVAHSVITAVRLVAVSGNVKLFLSPRLL